MSMLKTVVADKQWETSQKDSDKLQSQEKQMQTITFSLGSFDDESRTFKAIASTPIVDRMGDSVDQQGWDFTWFLKNPVVPWAHLYDEPPVARVIEIGVNNQGYLQFTYQAPPVGAYGFADTIWNLYRNQFMFAFSVGFIPHDYDTHEEGYVFTKCELLEISAVVVPANPQAIILAYKMGVVDEKGMKELRSKMISTLKNIDSALNKKDANVKKLEDKGAVADELAEEEIMDQKMQKASQIFDVVWAWCDVWFDEETPIDNYGTLVKELSELIAKQAGDSESSGVVVSSLKNVDKAKVDQLRSLLTGKDLTDSEKLGDTENMSKTKSGAAISADNKAKLKEIHDGLGNVMLSLDAHMDCLKEMMGISPTDPKEADDSEPDADDGKKAIVSSVNKDANEIPDKESEEGDVKPVDKAPGGGADQIVEDEKVDDKEPEQELEKEPEQEPEVEPEHEAEPEKESEEKGLTDDHVIDPSNLSEEEAEEIIRIYNDALKQK